MSRFTGMCAGFPAAMVIGVTLLASTGCSTAPKEKDQPAFLAESKAATDWFETRVPGLREQINQSAGYIVYPSVGQWGIIYTGGKFGRGMLNRPDGNQIGWAAINTGSLGLQAGVQGFKMVVVIQDEKTLNAFKENKLTGSVSGIAVVAETGGSGKAPFNNGLAVYQGANKGLMAGVNIAADYMRYKPLSDPE